MLQVIDIEYKCLFVLGNELRLSRVGLTGYAGRQHVVDGRACAVLLDVDCLHVKQGVRTGQRGIVLTGGSVVVESFRIVTPFAANQFERSKTQVGGLTASGQVHTHKADGLVVAYITDGANIVALNGNLELIPRHFDRLPVLEGDVGFQFLGYMLQSHLHLRGIERDVVFEILFRFAERVVAVDVLYIGRECPSRAVVVAGGAFGGVPLRTVDVLVTEQDGCFCLIVIRSAIVVVVVACGVAQGRIGILLPSGQYVLIHLVTKGCHIIGIRTLAFIFVGELLRGTQSVETYVLTFACVRFVGECNRRTRGARYVAPHRGVKHSAVCFV